MHTLPIDHYPSVSPQVVNDEPDRVVCMAWQRANTAAQATIRLLVGHRLPIPDEAQPVGLATGDGNGPGVDSVYLRPGTGEYVQATGGDADSRAMGQLFYVSDAGVRYHIKDLPHRRRVGHDRCARAPRRRGCPATGSVAGRVVVARRPGAVPGSGAGRA